METTVPAGSLVLVTGAGGFVGRATVEALLRKGYQVRAMIRKPAVMKGADVVIGDITDAAVLNAATKGVDAVIHLAARKSDEKDSEKINVGGTQMLADAAKKSGVKRVINVSTQSARLKRLGLYGRTKLASERVMDASGLAVITLRPSVVYGDEGGGILSTVLAFSKLPVIPMIGSGNVHFSPIHKDDLGDIIAASLTKGTIGGTYDVGGPESVSLIELTAEIQKRLGTRKMVFRIPIPVAMLIAKITQWMRRPPVTVSNVLGGSEDMTMDIKPMLRDFGVTPRGFGTGMDAVFRKMKEEEKRAEAAALLRYVFSGFGSYEPSAEAINQTLRAFEVHGVTSHRLDPKVVRKPRLLGALDAVAGKDSILRKKVLIAAAIGECQPETARFTLPQNNSVIRIVCACGWMAVRTVCKKCFGLIIRLTSPAFFRRNAGQ